MKGPDRRITAAERAIVEGHNVHNPHTDLSTWVAATSTTPSSSANPPVSSSIAACATLNPESAWSTARTFTEFPSYVSVQHVPHAAEFHPPTAAAPPIWGNFGSEPKVEKPLVRSPFVPLYCELLTNW